MAITMSDVDVRRRIGEVLRQVAETQEPVIVEWDGKPQVAVVAAGTLTPSEGSSELARELEPDVSIEQQWDRFDRLAEQARALVARDLAGRPAPDPADLIREARKVRDAEFIDPIIDNLRRR